MNLCCVAQVGNLLFRRLAVGGPYPRGQPCGLPIRETADCQSALRRRPFRFRVSRREILVRRILSQQERDQGIFFSLAASLVEPKSGNWRNETTDEHR